MDLEAGHHVASAGFSRAEHRAFECEAYKDPASALTDDETSAPRWRISRASSSSSTPSGEGNARTIKLTTNLLAVQTGRPLLVYDPAEDGQRRYIAGGHSRLPEGDGPMAAVIRRALETARQAG